MVDDVPGEKEPSPKPAKKKVSKKKVLEKAATKHKIDQKEENESTVEQSDTEEMSQQGSTQDEAQNKPAETKTPSVSRTRDNSNVSSVETASSGRGMAWTALIVALISLSAGGYAWYQNTLTTRTQTSQQSSQLETLRQQFSALDQATIDSKDRLNEVKEQALQVEETVASQIRAVRKEVSDQQANIIDQITSSKKVLTDQEQRFSDELKRLSDSVDGLKAEIGDNIDSWNLEEAEQLVFVAIERLQLSEDVETSLKALRLADKRLASSSNPDVIGVRQQLSKDIGQLVAIELPDFSGVLASISILSNDLKALPVPGDVETLLEGAFDSAGNDTTSNTSVSGTTDTQGGNVGITESLVSAGKSFLGSLSDLVQIEKHGRTVKPVISSEIKAMMITKAELILESAQMAFQRKQYELFQQRMSDGEAWVEGNFSGNSELTKAWLEKLRATSAAPLNVELPDISGSLKSIQALTK